MRYRIRAVTRRSKIVCTLGPASDAPRVLAGMVAAGMDIARLNFSHGSEPEHRARAEAVRREARRTGRLEAGEERSLVDDRPGTTRDTVDALVRFEIKRDGETIQQPLVVLDTAGIRRKSKVSETVESV